MGTRPPTPKTTTHPLPPFPTPPPPPGLDDNAYNKTKCEAVFDAYKECKGKEYAAKKQERLDARRGKKGRLFG